MVRRYKDAGVTVHRHDESRIQQEKAMIVIVLWSCWGWIFELVKADCGYHQEIGSNSPEPKRPAYKVQSVSLASFWDLFWG